LRYYRHKIRITIKPSKVCIPNGSRPKAVKASHAQAAMSGHAAACRRRMMKAYPRVSSGLIGGGKRRRRWRRDRVRHPRRISGHPDAVMIGGAGAQGRRSEEEVSREEEAPRLGDDGKKKKVKGYV